MRKEQLLENLQNMDEVMARTARPTDIWQDRCVYWMAKALKDILTELYKKDKMHAE